MRYAVVFSLAVRHSYYADGTCGEVEIRAVAGTATILRRHRWMARTGVGKTSIFAEVDEAGRPLIALDPSVILQFKLVQTGRDFALFTELGGITPATVFAPSDGDTGPVRGLRPRTAPNAGPLSGAIAGVEIPGSVLPVEGERPLEFQVQFEARRTRWKYYCVTDLKLNGRELEIVDRDSSEAALRFSAVNRTDLNQKPDPRDPVAVQLAQRFPGLTKVRFLSDDLVPCCETPRRKLELLLGSNRFPEPLPNPALTNHSSVAVELGGKSLQQPALYQVVTYLIQPHSEKGD